MGFCSRIQRQFTWLYKDNCVDKKLTERSAGFGPYSEVAFFHRPSQTLLVTDAVVQIPATPPEVNSWQRLILFLT